MISDIDYKIDTAFGYMHNDAHKALDIFKGILEIQPDNIRATNGKASALMKLKRIDEAEEYFNKSLALGDNVSALINLGLISMRKTRYESALRYFDKAIELKPELAGMITGFKKDILDNYDTDKADYRLTTFNDDADRLIVEGLKHEQMGKYWDAIDFYERAITMDSSSRHVVEAMIRKLDMHIEDEFLYEDRTSYNIMNNPLKLKVERAILIEKRHKKVSKLLDQLLTENPDDIAMINYKGGLEFSLYHYDESITYFDKCIDLSPEYYYAIFNKGLVLRRLKRYEEALLCFDKLLENPNYYIIIKPHKSGIMKKLVSKSPPQ